MIYLYVVGQIEPGEVRVAIDLPGEYLSNRCRLISAIASETLATVVHSNPSLVSITGRVCLIDSSSSTNRNLGRVI